MEIDSQKYPYPARLRHHTCPACYIPANELTELPDNYPPLVSKIDWTIQFLNSKPANVLDVGCGKAGLLLDYSEAHPDDNILGIEVRESIAKWAENLIKAENIQNASVLWYSVINGLDFLESNSFDRIFYLFPDPWTKRKHLKRRAFTTETLDIYHRLLKPGGRLYLATDVEEVHDYHLSLVSKHPNFTFKIIETDEEWGLPVTNKERFCRREMILFDRIIATKI